MTSSRRRIAAPSRREILAIALAAAAPPAFAQTSGAPVRVGGTLSLTGPLAATGVIHKIVGEIFIQQANKAGGMLGRPIEWVQLHRTPDYVFYNHAAHVNRGISCLVVTARSITCRSFITPSRTAWPGASNVIGIQKIFCDRTIRFLISIGSPMT